MAFNDTLFQLGMDLTRSSTAQKEDHDVAAPRGRELREDVRDERDGVPIARTHLVIDLFGARRLNDLKHIERTLRRCVKASGATLVHIHLRHVAPNGGVSGVALLADSHISFRSWPEADYAALDVIPGGAMPRLAADMLKNAFGATDVRVKEHVRGQDLDLSQRRPATSQRHQEFVAAKAA